jgi:serine protease Do
LTGQDSGDDEELSNLAKKFVRVRIIQMGGVDLSVFRFDPFLSWSLFLMNGDKTIYGRFGTASPKTRRDTKDSNPSHTTAGLKAALRKALEMHAAYQKDPAEMGKVLLAKRGPKPRWRTIESMPAAKKYGRLGRMKGTDQESCAHCHEVQRARIDSCVLTGQRITDDMLWVYPNPQVLGLTLSRDHCARVTRVGPGSYAAKAGLEVGDDILTMQGQPLLSVADVQWVLQTFPNEGGKLRVSIRRDGKELEKTMTLPRLWRRKGDFGWRYRVAGYAMWLWSGVTLQDHAKGVRVSDLSPWWFKKPNRHARKVLRRGDVIVEVDGKRGWSRSRYIAYLMREKKPGSIVRLKVIRDGGEAPVRFRLPAKQPEVLGH